jgi:hypothetical protein
MAAATTPNKLLMKKHIDILRNLLREADLLVYGRKT